MRYKVILAIFSTLVWKNFQKQVNNRLILIISLVLPMLSTLLLLIFPSSYEAFHTQPIKGVDDTSFGSNWNALVEKINARRERMLGAQRNFQANVFIPQISVAYAPSSHVGIKKLMEAALGRLITKNQIREFIDCDAMRIEATSEHFIASVCFHNVDVDESKNGLPQKLNFSIIMPSEVRNYDQAGIGHSWKQGSSMDGRQFAKNTDAIEGDSSPEYLREGFVPLQYYISEEYIKIAAASTDFKGAKVPAASLRQLNMLQSSHRKLSERTVTITILMIVFGYMFPVIVLVKFIVEEYETGQSFVLEVNGVSKCLQAAAWFCNGCTQLLLTSICLPLFLVLKGNATLLVIPFFASYCFSVTSFIILISALIRTANLALVMVPIIWLLMPFPFLFIEEFKFQLSHVYLIATLFLCNVTLSRGLTLFVTNEHNRRFLPGAQFLISAHGDHLDFGLIPLIGLFLVQTLFYSLLVPIIQSHTMLRFGRFLKRISPVALVRRYKERRRKRRQLEENILREKMALQNETTFIQNFGRRGPGEGTDSVRRPDVKETRKKWNFNWFSKKKEIPKEATIEFRRVSKKFANAYVVKRFTLSVFPGEIVVLMGHNSSGKTTIMRMMCGLTLPTRGEIYVSGVNIFKRKLYFNMQAFKHVGMSLSYKALLPDFTVFDHLVFFCRLRGLQKEEAKQEVRTYLLSMQMVDVQGILVRNLSFGQKRILQSLCAFAGRTDIVMIHKPLDGVDEATARLFFSFIQQEKRNRSIFITTNRSKVASGVADRIAILSKGELVFLGTERQLCQDFNDSYRLTFFGSAHCDFDKVHEFLETFTTTEVEMESQMGDLAVFLINKEEYHGMIRLLDAMPKNKDGLKIDSFQIQDGNLDQILINWFTPEPFQFALQDSDPEPFPVKTRFQALKRFFSRLSNFGIVIRHRVLIDARNRPFLLVKVFLPMLVGMWMAFCFIFLLATWQLKRERAFPIDDDRDRSGVTFAQQESFLDDDGPLKAAYRSYEATGAIKVDADLDITDLRSLRNSHERYADVKILGTAKFAENEVEALFNNEWLRTAPHSLALVMNSLAVGFLGPDSGIKADLDPLPNSTLEPLPKYNVTLLCMTALCFSFCFIWTLPMLFMTLDRDSRFNYIELIAGMRLSVMVIAIMAYELFVFVISFCTLHLVVLILRLDVLMDLYVFRLYAHTIMIVALCVLSINILISLGSRHIQSGYLMVLAFHTLGITIFIVVNELPPLSGPSKFILIFFDFLPLFSLMENLMNIAKIAETNWLCSDMQIYETSVYAEQCQMRPNCCGNAKQEYSHFRNIICVYILICPIWALIYIRVRSPLSKRRPRTKDIIWDSDADSHHDQHVLHITQPTEVQNTWINEKSRVRTLERSMIWTKSIHVEHLSVLFGQYVALNKVNFMVDRHQVLSVFGANGSGKTVLMKAILGIYSANTGQVGCPNRVPYDRFKPEIGNLAGYSAQEVYLMQELTVVETIKLVLRIRNLVGVERLTHEAIIICKMLNLYDYRYHFLSICSQGVLKRLSIALAMMTNAELILLDDPFANLDVITQHSVRQSIQDACGHGMCIIYTCSDTDYSAPAQRIAALGRHGFAACGERREISQDYYSSYYVVETRIYLSDLETMNDTEPTKGRDSRTRRMYEKMTDFVENIFPHAIIRSINYPWTCFWLSSRTYSMVTIFQKVNRNKNAIYSYSISQPSVGAIFLQIPPEHIDNAEFGY